VSDTYSFCYGAFMDTERFVERILETENLTDELEDADANWLLDWGIGRLDRVLRGAEDVETAGTRVNALMAVMRKINRIMGSYADKSPQRLAEDLADLHGLFNAAFGPADAPPEPPAEPEPPTDQPSDPEHPSQPLLLLPSGIPTPPETTSPTEETPPPQDDQQNEQSSESDKAPEPSSLDFTMAAKRLSQLATTEALHFLADDFYPDN
jgi:hypothetical protein